MAPYAPIVFVSHGSPMVAVETDRAIESWKKFGSQNHPSFIVTISAHWFVRDRIEILDNPHPGIFHDFTGFPEELYRVDYPVTVSPKAVDIVREVLHRHGLLILNNHKRKIDHGVWTPLMHMYPAGKIPIVQITLPIWKAGELLQLGKFISDVRQYGGMVLCSGGAVHNLGLMDFENKFAAPEAWAIEYQNWVKKVAEAKDHPALDHWIQNSPDAQRAHPTIEHFLPLIIAVGAATDQDNFELICDDIQYGNLSMLAFAYHRKA